MNKYLSIAVSTGILITGWITYANLYRRSYEVPVSPRAVHLPFDSEVIDRQIKNQERAVARDPFGALGWSMLASAYMARSRESDDLATAVKAEMAARKSLSIRTSGNVGARNKLIQALLQQHRFKDALAQCEKAEAIHVSGDDTVALYAECLVEVGQYDQAGQVVTKHPRAFEDAASKTVVARILDAKGRPDEALKIYRKTASAVDQMDGISSDTIAWFHARLATQLAKMGHHVESRGEFTTALKLYPTNYKAMAGLARLASQDQAWQDVIQWGIWSDTIAPMVDVRSLVGDAYAKLGDAAKAEEQYGRVAALVGRPSGMNDGLHEITTSAGTHGHRLDRQYAIFCADHNRDLVGAYAAAIRDFDARKDIYAYDTLAWVCLRMGATSEARKSIDLSLSRGTKDAMVLYHAGEIYSAIGEAEKAASYFRCALEVDPHFDGIAVPRAQEKLKELTSRGESR